MNTTPNFALQVQETEKKLQSEWQTVREGWKDKVSEDFNIRVMEPYMRNFQQYVTGEGISGYGVEQLVQQMEKHMQDMDSVAGY